MHDDLDGSEEIPNGRYINFSHNKNTLSSLKDSVLNSLANSNVQKVIFIGFIIVIFLIGIIVKINLESDDGKLNKMNNCLKERFNEKYYLTEMYNVGRCKEHLPIKERTEIYFAEEFDSYVGACADHRFSHCDDIDRAIKKSIHEDGFKKIHFDYLIDPINGSVYEGRPLNCAFINKNYITVSLPNCYVALRNESHHTELNSILNNILRCLHKSEIIQFKYFMSCESSCFQDYITHNFNEIYKGFSHSIFTEEEPSELKLFVFSEL